MCTVTFVPLGDRFFITSNRDEKAARQRALPPEKYTHGGVALLYPKDADAGGSWIAMTQQGHVAVLLNGAFTKHVPRPPYQQSRGIIFLEVMAATLPVKEFERIDMPGIAPFTMVLWEDGTLYECRWDGNEKHFRRLCRSGSYIWSSVTLYSPENIRKREQWFSAWRKQYPQPTEDDIIQFHLSAGDGDTQNDLRMNREGKLFTVSVTSMEYTGERGSMHYADLQSGQVCRTEMDFISKHVA